MNKPQDQHASASPTPLGARHKRRQRALHRQRAQVLEKVERGLDLPMTFLGFVWLALLIVDLVHGLSPCMQTTSNAIWIVFILNFLLEFTVAPDKSTYLRRNWLTAISLLAPALRLLRVLRLARALRAARVARGLRLLRIVSSVNRGLAALGAHMSRRGFGYAVALTLIVTLAGSAGMLAFENEVPGGLKDYGSALWWTAMLMTTMGSEYWPRTAEGRLLCLLLALYAFAMFGYVTASLASFFIGRDAASPTAEVAGGEQIERLAREVAACARNSALRCRSGHPAELGALSRAVCRGPPISVMRRQQGSWIEETRA